MTSLAITFKITETILPFRFDESSSDKEILDMLLEKKRYDKRLLPPVNGKLRKFCSHFCSDAKTFQFIFITLISLSTRSNRQNRCLRILFVPHQITLSFFVFFMLWEHLLKVFYLPYGASKIRKCAFQKYSYLKFIKNFSSKKINH